MKQCNICNFSCKNNIGTYVGKNAKVLFLFESPTFQSDVDGRILSGPVNENGGTSKCYFLNLHS